MLETATIENVRVLPEDVHNQTLVPHVHPPDWVNPEPAPRYNLVVIGAGTAGLVTAAGAAGLGAKVVLVEKHLMGGDGLRRILDETTAATVSELADCIQQQVTEFRHGPPHDDMTLIVAELVDLGD